VRLESRLKQSSRPRSEAGKEFQDGGPAAANELSPSGIYVLGSAYIQIQQ